ncbi:hypothetical protein NMG60_11036298 [Bertholletia excelsa]
MLEDRSYLVSPDYPRGCERGNSWPCMSFQLENGKRKLEINLEEELGARKLTKQSEAWEIDNSTLILEEGSIPMADQSCHPHQPRDDSDSNSPIDILLVSNLNKQPYEISMEEELGSSKLTENLNDLERVDSTSGLDEDSMSAAGQSSHHHQSGDNSNSDFNSLNKRPLEIDMEDELSVRKSQKQSETHERVGSSPIFEEVSLIPVDGTANKHHSGDSSDSDFLTNGIARDGFICCLIHCSRVDYSSIASLNRSFRSLVRSGELYRMRRKNGIIEHWIYISCNLLEWEAFDPNSQRWMPLPMMPSSECFFISDKESLAVGTELLVFAKEMMVNVIYRYSLLTNSWSSGMTMNAPRCLFGSASLGEIAIVAGGCDSVGNALDSAELYNSETGVWHTLPSMNKARKMCSGVFMDGKFYVIGGVGGPQSKLLTCGEEYDLATRTWVEIPNMSPVRNGVGENEMPATSEAPPLVAVVDNQLYAADHAQMEVRKYDKEGRVWHTVGRLPEGVASMNGWGLAFRACGNKLICIGGPRTMGEGFIEVNSWIPSEGNPEWNLLGRKRFASFVYNCAVMGC